uniref:sigma-54 interaction domain-containing protein n=1 Tax=Castellaniella defragrans TaxID=75697 RepID=UPI0033423E10
MKFFSLMDAFPSGVSAEDLKIFFSDNRLWALCDQMPDGLIVVNSTGLIVYMNKAAESMNEVSRKILLGQHLRNLLSQSQLAYDSLLDDFTQGLRTSRVIFDADDREYTLITRVLGTQDESGRYFLIIIQNNAVRASATQKSPKLLGRGMGLKGEDAVDLEVPFITCPDTQALLKQSLRTVALGSHLLLLGESGVGKSQLARYVHKASGLGGRPFVHINCGSIPDTLFESEMFGYERGSFTGASARGKKGLIEAADGGTLFLDEVGEIPLQSQAKILQVLEEGMVQRVGSTTPRRLRMQVIAATNCDLRAAVRNGSFRRDLYYRLNVITLVVPPLRQRKNLLPLLIDYFLHEVNMRRPLPLSIDEACRSWLLSYQFPGNIRELQNIIEYLSVMCDEVATIDALPRHQMDLDDLASGFDVNPCPAPDLKDFPVSFEAGFDLRQAVRNYEKGLIGSAILQAGSKRGAAKLLNVDIATIVRKSNADGN